MMRYIKIGDKIYFDFTKEEHIKKHTLKEDTHNFNCPYCEGVKR